MRRSTALVSFLAIAPLGARMLHGHFFGPSGDRLPVLTGVAILLVLLLLPSRRREGLDRWPSALVWFLVLSTTGTLVYCEVRDVHDLKMAQERVDAVLASNDPCDVERLSGDEVRVASKAQKNDAESRRAECRKVREAERHAKEEEEWQRTRWAAEKREAELKREAEEAKERQRKSAAGSEHGASSPSWDPVTVRGACPALSHPCASGSESWCCPSGTACYPQGWGMMKCMRRTYR